VLWVTKSIANFFSAHCTIHLSQNFILPICSWEILLTDKHKNNHSHLMALCPGLPGWAGTKKVESIWILLKQVTVSGNGISWAVCKSAPRSVQVTTPALHYSQVFYRPDAFPAAQPTVSKHWRQKTQKQIKTKKILLPSCGRGGDHYFIVTFVWFKFNISPFHKI